MNDFFQILEKAKELEQKMKEEPAEFKNISAGRYSWQIQFGLLLMAMEK